MVIKNPYQRKYLNGIGVKPVAYNPIFAHIFLSPTAAIFLSQILYWWGKGRKPGWIYKTVNEIEDETGLTEYQQRTAIRKCVNKGILKTKLAGIPAKRHFQIIESELDKLVNNYLQNLPQLSEKTKNKNVEKLEPSSGEDQELIQIVPSDNSSEKNSENTQEINPYRVENADAFFKPSGIFSSLSNKPDGVASDNVAELIAHLTAVVGQPINEKLKQNGRGEFPEDAYEICIDWAKSFKNFEKKFEVEHVATGEFDFSILNDFVTHEDLKSLFQNGFSVIEICKAIRVASKKAQGSVFNFANARSELLKAAV